MTGSPFSRLFAPSPFADLQNHIVQTHIAVEKLEHFLTCVIAKDWKAASKIHQEIFSLENKADVLKRKTRLNLPNSLFMPVARSDMLELISQQDRIANKAKDIAGLMLGRKMHLPAELEDSMQNFLAKAVATVAQAKSSILKLDKIVGAGFGKQTQRLLEEMLNKLDELEEQSDEQEIEIRAVLFSLEQSLPPVDVVFLYKIIDWIGELADRAQKVGSRLQIMLVR